MTSELISTIHAPVVKRWQDAPTTPLMVELPAGSFIMGENKGDKFANDTERPAHCVHIGPGTSIGCYPVTVGEYRHFVPHHALIEPDDLPVVGVSWEDAGAYCDWLSRMTGCAYRLPSEAEWEFACRAHSRTPFSWGSEITPADANYLYDEDGTVVGIGKRAEIGSYRPNAFGLHDLHGNVCEWVADTWHPNYEGAPDNGTAWVKPGDRRKVVRGGAWDYLPRLLRSPWRDWDFAEHKRDNVGFRVATSNARSG